MRTVLIVVGGSLFVCGAAGYGVVRVLLRPTDPELDEVYQEFEDRHPEVLRYDRWTRLTLGVACAGMLLLFLGMVF